MPIWANRIVDRKSDKASDGADPFTYQPRLTTSGPPTSNAAKDTNAGRRGEGATLDATAATTFALGCTGIATIALITLWIHNHYLFSRTAWIGIGLTLAVLGTYFATLLSRLRQPLERDGGPDSTRWAWLAMALVVFSATALGIARGIETKPLAVPGGYPSSYLPSESTATYSGLNDFEYIISKLADDDTTVRAAGIAQLGGIARKDPSTSDAVVSTLGAFLQQHTKNSTCDSASITSSSYQGQASFYVRSPDIFAALDVLNSLGKLSTNNLVQLDLHGASFNSRDLSNSYLSGSNLSFGNFDYADLHSAQLSNLAYGANCVTHAEYGLFRYGNLAGAELIGSSLVGASFDNACLAGANFSGATLVGASFSGARYDSDTRWPDGFDPGSAGARNTPCQ